MRIVVLIRPGPSAALRHVCEHCRDRHWPSAPAFKQDGVPLEYEGSYCANCGHELPPVHPVCCAWCSKQGYIDYDRGLDISGEGNEWYCPKHRNPDNRR
jgi:hypothetical protein